MQNILKLRYVYPSQEKLSDTQPNQKLMLRLAIIAIAVLMSVLGVMLNLYIDAVKAHLDGMQVSISRIAASQETFAVALARVEVSIRNIDHNMNKNEARLERMENRKP